MRKVIAAVVVLLLLLVAAPWGIGQLAEQRVNNGLDQVVKAAPYLTIMERKWQRGWFTSEQEVTFEVFGPWLRALHPAAPGGEVGENGKIGEIGNAPAEPPAPGTGAAVDPPVETPPPQPVDAASPLKFTVRNHVVHGPVLWFSGLGIARVDSHVDVPESVRAEIVKVFGEKPPAQISTRVRFFGGATTTISGDARELDLAVKTHSVSYDAFEITVGYSAHLDDIEVDGEWPRFEFTDREKGGSILMEGAAMKGSSHRVRGDLYDGDFELSVDTSRVVGADRQITEVANLHYVVDTTIDDAFMDVALKIGSGAVKAKEIEQLGLSFNEVHYDFTVRRLHIDTLVKLMAAIKASYTKPVVNAADVDAAMVQPMKQHGLELLKHDPEFVIDRIGVATPEGDAYIKGIIKLKGVTEQDLAVGAMGLVGKLDVDVTVDVARKLVEKLPNGASSVDGAVEQGLAKREGDHIVSRLQFQQGKLLVNGKEQGIPGLGAPGPGAGPESTPEPE
jgi:uncharacterized protein YdgA (DUF945 family)